MKNYLDHIFYTYKGKVTNIIDGDTIDAVVDLGFHISANLRFRLGRIDAHETRGDSEANEAKGRKESRYLESLILKETVYIVSSKTGKYGRWIAEVYLDKELTKNVNDFMKEYIDLMDGIIAGKKTDTVASMAYTEKVLRDYGRDDWR